MKAFLESKIYERHDFLAADKKEVWQYLSHPNPKIIIPQFNKESLGYIFFDNTPGLGKGGNRYSYQFRYIGLSKIEPARLGSANLYLSFNNEPVKASCPQGECTTEHFLSIEKVKKFSKNKMDIQKYLIHKEEFTSQILERLFPITKADLPTAAAVLSASRDSIQDVLFPTTILLNAASSGAAWVLWKNEREAYMGWTQVYYDVLVKMKPIPYYRVLQKSIATKAGLFTNEFDGSNCSELERLKKDLAGTLLSKAALEL